jgi:hypothetical protein
MLRIKSLIEVTVLLWFAASASSQTAPTIHQIATQSSCSNIVALSGAKVDCSNLTRAQKKALASIPAILKMAIENQNYFDAIMAKLDDISKTPPTCGSNCNQAGVNNGTQVVDSRIHQSAIELSGSGQYKDVQISNTTIAGLPSENDSHDLISLLSKTEIF